MARTSEQELNGIKNEIRGIMSGLQNSYDMLKGAQGISIEICTLSIDQIRRHLNGILTTLDRIDLSPSSGGEGKGANGSGDGSGGGFR